VVAQEQEATMRVTVGVVFLAVMAGACGGHGDDAGGKADSPAQEPAKEEAAAMAQERKVDATQITAGKIAEDAPFQSPEVEAAKSKPVQFAVTFTKQMPMPGYVVTVEEVKVLPPESGKDAEPKAAPRDWVIRVKIHEKPPEGPGLTVLDPMRIRIALGALKAGAYRLQLMVRSGDEKDHTVAQNVELVAK
jgi:hypothetical protein